MVFAGVTHVLIDSLCFRQSKEAHNFEFLLEHIVDDSNLHATGLSVLVGCELGFRSQSNLETAVVKLSHFLNCFRFRLIVEVSADDCSWNLSKLFN